MEVQRFHKGRQTVQIPIRTLGLQQNRCQGIGIRHGEKMYETLLTNEECAHAYDMGNFYRVPCDKRDLNYDNYFINGNLERAKLSEFNSNNTSLLSVEDVMEKIKALTYIQEEMEKDGLI